jgi:hypothetical protein
VKKNEGQVKNRCSKFTGGNQRCKEPLQMLQKMASYLTCPCVHLRLNTALVLVFLAALGFAVGCVIAPMVFAKLI